MENYGDVQVKPDVEYAPQPINSWSQKLQGNLKACREGRKEVEIGNIKLPHDRTD